ncbi:MAG: hydrogenase maturation nickel metallochaperone HypA [Candidatus Omnitrophota bacterium]|uniref:Hydrogenase maturation factor HypA n=1 Tax=Desulfofervidus auxilii TaxID=1621989 RepID=A0A7V1I3T3_DESA2|nr:MAG: hydrogenase maturation nickel metallochaperone HypA [Candidatus Omnitrophota bacterium]HEB73952.1 hydrogenase maturation nickel metallochaperone HypA [Candidatus Desulfofervidus auxilii]
MHELAIAEGILAIVQDQIETYKLKHVSCVKLKIGLLTAVVPEALNFCFDSLVKDTPLEKTNLKIELVPVKARCKNCGREFRHKKRMDFFFLCPICGGELEIITGKELLVEEIEGE